MGPINLSLNVGEGDAASFFTGQVVTPTYVADASMAAQNASYGRVQQAANMQLPGLTT
jgi:nitrogen fixation protein FixH